MIESLEDLEIEISNSNGKLYLFYGKPEEIVQKCIEELDMKGVFVNHDYTPYSIQRDKKIKAAFNQHLVSFQATHDLLLHPIEDTLKRDGQPYTVFTPSPIIDYSKEATITLESYKSSTLWNLKGNSLCRKF